MRNIRYLLFSLLSVCALFPALCTEAQGVAARPESSAAAALPGTWSQLFAATSPLHRTVASLKADGATVLPQSALHALWKQGIANQDLSVASWMFPVYLSTASDPVRIFHCTNAWGSNQLYHCNADGLSVHLPRGALPEQQSDAHIGIIDTTLNLEVDGWGCKVSSSAVSCDWGGKYPLGGSGLENSGSNAVHAGFAAGLFVVTAQELADGKIDHALGLLTHCLNNPTVYPADQHPATDASCGGTGAPSYGNLLHLLRTPEQIAHRGGSPECRSILTALATYGAYAMDTGNAGLAILTQHQLSYSAIGKDNLWETRILPDLNAGGDAKGSWWNSCLNHLSATDFELLQIPVGSY